MAYSKITWADRIDSGNKYSITDNGDGTSKIEYAGTVTQEGTPVNAENLNHMEKGIADAHSAVSDLEAATETALSGKVDKENGKGLSSNDYTTAEKNKLSGLSNYDDSALQSAVANKVDKETGKGLSSNDYTTAEKNKLAGLSNYDDSALQSAVANKVDKVTGKGLSTNDYTTAEKNKLAGLSNYDDTAVNNAMVRADAPDEDGKSQLYKVENGTRKNIDPVSSGAPYIYMTANEYPIITPEADKLYWVINSEGKHGVYKNGGLVEGEDIVPHIYGAVWDGTSSTTWTRTDDSASFGDAVPYMSGISNYGSPFDDLMPWSGMVKEERTGGTMVAIPKFWYKLTQDGDSIKIQIADGEVEGFNVSPAHMDRGDGKGERDVVYIGRYHCASDYKSKTGVKPVASIKRSSARTSIHNLGSNIWQMDFAMRFTLWLLYIVEFADWNSQAKIGYGCGNNSETENMGYTDSMPYHTGTTKASRTTYGVGTQYRYIEGLWDNVRDWCDGAYYNYYGMHIILNPANFSDSSGGTSVGTPLNGYPSQFTVKDVSGTFLMFIATGASGGGDSKFSCDFWKFFASASCLCVGGYYSQGLDYGLFFIDCYGASNTSAGIGCRPQELP